MARCYGTLCGHTESIAYGAALVKTNQRQTGKFARLAWCLQVRRRFLHLGHRGGYLVAAVENAFGLGAVAEDACYKSRGDNDDACFHGMI